jgi:peptidylprolyl isomerase domain and WD repeat-containing protein 1
MHRDVVTHLAVSKSTDFVVTGSTDGHVKFWKKMPDNIEFVKHFQAHLGAIHAFEITPDGKKLMTTSADQFIKFFEILIFDLANMIEVDYVPMCAVWLSSRLGASTRVAVADASSSMIRIYSAEGSQEIQQELSIHMAPVRCMATHPSLHCVVSTDSKGVIEYWDSERYNSIGKEDGVVSFKYKMETDLYDLAKARAVPHALVMSPKGNQFVVTSSDRQIRVFDFETGKIKRKYDESAKAYQGENAISSGKAANTHICTRHENRS